MLIYELLHLRVQSVDVVAIATREGREECQVIIRDQLQLVLLLLVYR